MEGMEHSKHYPICLQIQKIGRQLEGYTLQVKKGYIYPTGSQRDTSLTVLDGARLRFLVKKWHRHRGTVKKWQLVNRDIMHGASR